MTVRQFVRASALIPANGLVAVSRRDFLRLMGLAAGGAIVTSACGDGEDGSTDPTSPEVPSPSISSNYSFETVKHPESTKTTLFGIDDDGRAVGYFEDADGVHGFVRSPDGDFISTVDHPEAGDATVLFGVSNSGLAVGYYHDASNPGGYPGTVDFPPEGVASYVYVLDTDEFEAVPPPPDGTGTTIAFGVNDGGLISGWYMAEADNEQMKVKGFVFSRDAQDYEATFEHPDGVGGTLATGINNMGHVVGQYIGDDQSPHAFVWGTEEEGFLVRALDNPESEDGTCGQAINDLGVIAGFYFSEDGQHGYLSDGAETFTTLDNPKADVPGTAACGVNSQGLVVGDFYSQGGVNLGFLATPA